ncbi:MAG: CRTAC1 family protein [Bacteroidetes bacterium]|nr:MAG: CRTAC1 family protein [Bacteroidota bacterium]
MYLLNHSVHYKGTYQDTTLRQTFDVEAGDKLFQNNNNKFTDVSKKANIRGSALGYGLGVAIGDLNGDGWEDIYVSNDFHENDYLYYNNKNGTFSEKITQATGHTSRFSMGCDMADFNNDGKNDLLVLDMQPEDETVLKNSDGAEPYNIYQYKIGFGYHYQYARNTLQLNQGNGNFSEIALLSGVYATDWSWSALFCDLDNDGWKDIFISNGIARRPNDLDYLKFLSDQEVNRALAKGIDAQNLKFIEKMPKGKVANVAFRNNQDLTFNKISAEWGLDKIGFSNGSAYADLDNDGDLDLIVNNLNDLASVYRNESDTQIKNNFLKINLLGNNKNTFGIGTKVLIKHQGKMFYQEQQAARGFESSVEPVLTIGLGNLQNLDTVIVMWNDQKSEILTNVKALIL